MFPTLTGSVFHSIGPVTDRVKDWNAPVPCHSRAEMGTVLESLWSVLKDAHVFRAGAADSRMHRHHRAEFKLDRGSKPATRQMAAGRTRGNGAYNNCGSPANTELQ